MAIHHVFDKLFVLIVKEGVLLNIYSSFVEACPLGHDKLALRLTELCTCHEFLNRVEDLRVKTDLPVYDAALTGVA